jgi:hypothetical protein
MAFLAGVAAVLALGASGFGADVTNPWFPLVPGTRYVSTGVKDREPARDVMTVTRRVVVIAGIPCRAVDDRLSLSGRLAERTTDYYAQDARGNVWYFGEDTAELDRRGRVTSTSGTWRAGVGGAKPGIFMTARPRVGQTHRQEFLKGEAEDHFRVVAVTPKVVRTVEWTPVEPGVLDHKLYVRGVGTVLELTVKGGDERLELLSVTRVRR